MRLWFLWLALVLLISGQTSAQGDNLLRDPGFENTSMKAVATDEGDGTAFSVNTDWNGWYATSPRTADWQNRIPNGTGRNNAGVGFVRSGNRSMEISRGFATFTAAVYQTVDVPPGATVQGSAWYVMDLSEGASASARVGIDPNGGANPYDGDIAWSSWGGNQLATNGFRQLSVETVATGGQVTIFLFATQRVPTEANGIFWDDAVLSVVSAPDGGGNNPPPDNNGGDPPPPDTSEDAPAPRATQVNITPQAAQEDGSIIHVVGTGETTSAIARAYNVPLDDVLALNPQIGDGRLIRVGQRLTIRPAPEAEPPPRSTTLPPATFTPSPTEQAAEPTPTVVLDGAQICALIYQDTNQNRLRDVDETALANGTIQLELDDSQVEVFLTDNNPEPFCFAGLEPGSYTVIASPPAGYTLISSGRRLVDVQGTTQLTVAFGAVRTGQEVAEPQQPPDTDELIPQTVDDSPSDEEQLVQIVGLMIFGFAAMTLVLGGAVVFMVGRRYRG